MILSNHGGVDPGGRARAREAAEGGSRPPLPSPRTLRGLCYTARPLGSGARSVPSQASSHTAEIEMLRSRYERHGQGHVFRFWDRLDAGERRELLEQAAGIDLPAVLRALASARQPEAPDPRKLEPAAGRAAARARRRRGALVARRASAARRRCARAASRPWWWPAARRPGSATTDPRGSSRSARSRSARSSSSRPRSCAGCAPLRAAGALVRDDQRGDRRRDARRLRALAPLRPARGRGLLLPPGDGAELRLRGPHRARAARTASWRTPTATAAR